MHGKGACVAGFACMAGFACIAGGMCGRGMHGRGHVWQGVCVAGSAWQGGMCGRECMAGGHAWQGGTCMVGSMRGRGEGACVAGETATAADDTHPTGMHSSLFDENLLVTSGTRFNETVLTLISISTVLF